MLFEFTRKVQHTSQGHPFVSLDKKWADANEVKKGDVVNAFADSGVVVFITPNSPLNASEELDEFKANVKMWVVSVRARSGIV